MLPGLKDVNGREINVGDVVSYIANTTPSTATGEVIRCYYNGTVLIKDSKSNNTRVVHASVVRKITL